MRWTKSNKSYGVEKLDEQDTLRTGSSSEITALGISNWDALLNKDAEIAKIADKLKLLGQKWVDTFAQLYLAVNDKRQLPNILQTVFAAARQELEHKIDPTTRTRRKPPRPRTRKMSVGIRHSAAPTIR